MTQPTLPTNPTTPDVMLTGASSEIGLRILRELARRPDIQRVFVLARRRIRSFPRSLKVIRADMTQPESLRAAAAILRAEAFNGVVMHLAANTNFLDEEACYTVNYHGALHWLEALRAVPGLRRFVYLGTAMNCGIQPSGFIREDDPLPLERAQHLTAYTHSKALAEQAIYGGSWPFEIRTLKPSIMMSCAADLPPLRDNIFWAVKAFFLIGVAPLGRQAGIDALPGDFGARAIVRLALKPACRHDKYFIAAGLGHARTFHEFTTRLEDLLRANGNQAALNYLALPVFGPDWAAARADLSPSLRKLAGSLYHHYQFVEMNVRFDQARMVRELELEPSEVPSHFDVLPTLAHYWDRVRVSPRTMATYI